MSDDKMREALMEEAKCMVEYHPSKDAISFARSVLSYLSQQPESEPDDYTADNLAEEVCDRLETILGRGIDGDGSPYSIAVDAVDFVVHAIKESGLQFDDEDNTFRQPSPQVPESEAPALCDWLYRAGYVTRGKEKDYDPRGHAAWQACYHAITAAPSIADKEKGSE